MELDQCLSKTVAEIADLQQESDFSDEDLYSDTIYLNAVNRDDEKQWITSVLVEKYPVTFKTAAEVTAMSDTTFNSIQNSMPHLKKSTQTLCGPNRSPLDVVGETTLNLTYKGKSSAQRVFVIPNLQNSLLGLPAIKALAILSVYP